MARTATTTNTRTEPTRIPLVGEFNTRLFTALDTDVDSGIVGIGVVGDMIVGNLTAFTGKDQRFINVIPDKLTTEITGTTKFYCYKRPGFATNTTPASGNIGTAIKIWTGLGNEVISAFGDTNSTIYNGTSSLGTITGTATDIVEATVGSTPTLLIPSSDNKMYYYQDGGSITEITNGNFPSNNSLTITGSPVNMNGYTFIMTTSGRIQNSDRASITDWSASGFISANTYPDRGVGLARYKDLIIAFGEETLEFYRDIGNPDGSPLERMKELSVRIGCIGPEAIVPFEDNVAWVASSDVGTISVYMLDGFKPVRISDNVVDAFLGTKAGSTVRLTAAKMRGKSFIFAMYGSITWVYCVEDQTWHQWVPASQILWHRFAASSAATEALFSISRGSTDGKVYIVNPVNPAFTDDGSNYEFLLQTSKVDLNNTNKKRLHKLHLVADNTLSSTNMSISWSDDDYDSFSTARTVDMVNDDKYLNNLGQFRRRAFRFSNTSSEALRLEAIDLYYSEGLK
jgi:hypothetical protein